MSIRGICDWCGHETTELDTVQTTNLLHLAKNRTGKDVEGVSPLLPGGEHPDYCHSCYRTLVDWLNGSLRQWITTNFPLVRHNVTIH